MAPSFRIWIAATGRGRHPFGTDGAVPMVLDAPEVMLPDAERQRAIVA